MSQAFLLLRIDTPPSWMPSMVWYGCDHTAKGLALFSSWLSAEQFKNDLEKQSKLKSEIKTLGDEVPARDYYYALLAYIGDHGKTLQLPVYIDPTDQYAKGVSPRYATLERFLLKNFQNDIPWDMEFVRCDRYLNCTICLLRNAATKAFLAVTMRGDHTTRESISAAIEDAVGTTEQRYYTRTKMSLIEDAVLKEARGFINRIPMR